MNPSALNAASAVFMGILTAGIYIDEVINPGKKRSFLWKAGSCVVSALSFAIATYCALA